MPPIEDDINIKSKQDELTCDTLPICELHNYLCNHATLITANQRLARFRLQQYEQKQIQAGKTAWHTPRIMSWPAWLQTLWQEHQAKQTRVLLGRQQEALFWRDVVSHDEQIYVLNPKALAKQAMDAWQILADYLIDPSCLLSGGEEHLALYRWGKEIQVRITQANPAFVQQSEALQHLQQHIMIPYSDTIIVDGFDMFYPAQVTFFKHLQSLGYPILETIQDAKPATPHLHVYHDEEAELRAVCQHIRAIVTRDKSKTIGVFVPDLEQRAAQINQIFS